MRFAINTGTKQSINAMKQLLFLFAFISIFVHSFSQVTGINRLLNDPSMLHASVSISIIDTGTGKVIPGYDSQRNLVPASIMKLITTAAALELLGPEYTFTTTIGYSGTIDNTTKTLKGDLIIKGGGDPCLGSEYFDSFYGDFISKWSSEIRQMGIDKIEGSIISDDSFYDYEPVPSKWLWEDMGNYYGAGTYGLSIFDNYYSVHFRTSKAGSKPEITAINPTFAKKKISNFLVSGDTRDEGYLFAAPYGDNTWVSGTIPENRNDFILKGSISDPPLLAAKLLHEKLMSSGVVISGEPSTRRLLNEPDNYEVKTITETISPHLHEIINVLNHESINLYAESLTKHMGLVYKNEGSTESGIAVIKEFLNHAGIDTEGIKIVDGSGLSPVNYINASELAKLLLYMKKNSKYFKNYLESFPEAGKPGTLNSYFTDPFFKNRLRLKTGSMTGVRSFAGYVTANSGKEMIITIIVNNYSGSSEKVISCIEEIIKQNIIEN
jgi:D-alanyl-D-alanine carboxypeptidase/D-alanyl-D-alanine-endopeptidase (penicillin-binding protein 4)